MPSESTLNVCPVVLCGGSGTRLWPLSRTGFPKQFLALTGAESLFQQAVRRLRNLAAPAFRFGAMLIVTGEEHRFLVREQLREIGVEAATLLLEPTARNTAPALSLAALAATEGGLDPVLVVTPADQLIADGGAYTAAVPTAIQRGAAGEIVVLGIRPDRPETGYGYIQIGECTTPPLTVMRFVEKPDAATAQRYLDEGGYYWNAGIFVLKASVWLRAIESFRPDIAAATRTAWAVSRTDGAFIRPGAAEFAAIPSDSIDYAVMESCPGSVFPIKMVLLDVGWSDLGAWDAVWSALPKDRDGNAQRGDVIATNCRNTLVHAAGRLVAVVGVDDLIVIETPDAVLVADKSRSQEVMRIVSQLQDSRREEHALHRKVHRPSGWYDCIDDGDRFKVKCILVKPGASLSLQKHHHRAEHWVDVKGTAQITCGEKNLLADRKPVYLYPAGRSASPGQPRHHPAGNRRSAIGQLSGRGRHRALRRPLRAQPVMMNPGVYPKVYVAGHRGTVGSAIVRQLLAQGHPPERIVTRTHAELDLTDPAAVRAFFAAEQPEQVYLAAAKVGGIYANNSYPAEFIYQT